MSATYIPMAPAGERASGTYTGPISYGTGPTGYQPQGDNNPAGQVPGILAMAITLEVAATLEGPQPS
jgi:hypothetical protein